MNSLRNFLKKNWIENNMTMSCYFQSNFFTLLNEMASKVTRYLSEIAWNWLSHLAKLDFGALHPKRSGADAMKRGLLTTSFILPAQFTSHRDIKIQTPVTCPTVRLKMSTSPKLRPVILLTNDDGVSPVSALILPLARQICEDELADVIVVAPGKNNSACGQRITLSKKNVMRRHLDYEQEFAPSKGSNSLQVFSIDDGTPCDTILASVEPKSGLCAKLLTQPRLVVSGINVGQNLGTDVIYSGTFSAARQSAFYGIPSIALSLNLYTPTPNSEKYTSIVQKALSASTSFISRVLPILPDPLPDYGRLHTRKTLKEKCIAHDTSAKLQDRLIDAFSRGDVTFNVNFPSDEHWDGSFSASTLDSVLYRSTVEIKHVPSGIEGSKDETLDISFSGARPDKLAFPGSDVDVIRNLKIASVCPVSTWPVPHPLALQDQFFEDAVTEPTVFWDKPLPKGRAATQKL